MPDRRRAGVNREPTAAFDRDGRHTTWWRRRIEQLGFRSRTRSNAVLLGQTQGANRPLEEIQAVSPLELVDGELRYTGGGGGGGTWGSITGAIADQADLQAELDAKLPAGGTSAQRIAAGTTAQRPSTPAAADLRYNSTTGRLEYFDGSNWNELQANVSGVAFTVGTDSVNSDALDDSALDKITSIASGASLGLQQNLLASDGQVGKTVLAVAYTFYQGSEGPSANHKAQIASLGEGNVVFVYASGADFLAGNAQEGPIFLGLGEVYVIESVQAGAIITATEGAYGFSQQRQNNDESPMPLLSLALASTDTFLYAFRNSQTYAPGADSNAQGFVHVVNGPIASVVTLTNGAGAVVQGQENIALEPWAYLRLYTSGNQEYRLRSTNPVMAAVNAEMGSATPRFYDSRLVMPLTNDGITWPRSGFGSAPYANTRCRYWVNDGAAWDQGSGAALTLNPGSPLDIDASQPAGTGANDADYEPRGATRFKADGLISAYSGDDSSGLEASPMCPVSAFTQRIALPLHIRAAGDGGNNGIALASIYEGVARLYEWDPVSGAPVLVTVNAPGGGTTTTIDIVRRSGAVATPDDQNYPASALISNGSDPESHGLAGDFNGGYIEVTVPCTCVFNSEQNENGQTNHTFRGTSGSAVVGIHSDDDEQLTFGITPPEIAAEVAVGDDGLTYRRTIQAGGTEAWVLA